LPSRHGQIAQITCLFARDIEELIPGECTPHQSGLRLAEQGAYQPLYWLDWVQTPGLAEYLLKFPDVHPGFELEAQYCSTPVEAVLEGFVGTSRQKLTLSDREPLHRLYLVHNGQKVR
jgi:hypothetical protein